MSFHSLIVHFFIILNNTPLYDWLYHSLFFCSHIEEHLDYFQFLAVMCKATINIYACRFLYGCKLSTHLSKHLGAWLLDYEICPCLALSAPRLFSKVAIPFHIPTRGEWEFLVLHFHTHIWDWRQRCLRHSWIESLGVVAIGRRCSVVSMLTIAWQTGLGWWRLKRHQLNPPFTARVLNIETPH